MSMLKNSCLRVAVEVVIEASNGARHVEQPWSIDDLQLGTTAGTLRRRDLATQDAVANQLDAVRAARLSLLA